jgi:hypothetical protein
MKKLLSLLLAFTFILALAPLAVFAEESVEDPWYADDADYDGFVNLGPAFGGKKTG